MTTRTPLVRKTYDVLERAVATYVQVFAGLLVAANTGFTEVADLSVVKTCAISALPAALSVLKSLAAINLPVGDSSASVLRVGYERVKRVVERVEVPFEVRVVERVFEPAPKEKRAVKTISTTPVKAVKKATAPKHPAKKEK